LSSLRALSGGPGSTEIMMSNRDEPDRSNPDDHLADFDQRLSVKIEAKRAKDRKYDRPSSESLGWRYGSEFFAGVLIGMAFGLVFDAVAGTSPLGLIVGSLFGFCAGTLNVVRAVKKINALNERED